MSAQEHDRGGIDVWAEHFRQKQAEPKVEFRPLVAARSPFVAMLVRFRKQRLGLVALGCLIVVSLIAFMPGLPFDPTTQNLSAILQYPSSAHWLGTDDLGRDVFSRLIAGARVSLLAGAQATLIAVGLGLPLGVLAGYVGGRLDRAIMFLNDAVMAMPGLLLAIAIVGMLGPGLTNAMIAVGIVFVPVILRLVRATVLEVREETYVEAARSLGAPTWRIVCTHVLPNIMPPLTVAVTVLVGRSMLAEASLSFLGLGAQYPETSWGAMLGSAFPFVDRSPLLLVFPGIAICIVVLSFNILGDALRDSMGREQRKD